jgi:hypothetical protein
MRGAEFPRLGLKLWYYVLTGEHPSQGLVDELYKIMDSHRDKLKALDEAAGKTPEKKP